MVLRVESRLLMALDRFLKCHRAVWAQHGLAARQSICHLFRLHIGPNDAKSESWAMIGTGYPNSMTILAAEMLVLDTSSVKSALDCHWHTCRAIPVPLRPCASVFVWVLPKPASNVGGQQPPG